MSDRYTAITFSPVQGFIEKSRKLRDLYGSSFILSYLAHHICNEARAYLGGESDPVISPALISVAQGTPNQIIVRGEFPREEAQEALNDAWEKLVVSCKTWIESSVTTTATGEPIKYFWDRPWREWINHNWEFFWATGGTINQARHNLNQQKTARAWTGVNYVGESSTLSGLDSRAWPALGRYSPHSRPKAVEEAEVRAFYELLSEKLDDKEATIAANEQLSIPELVKRLVTIDEVVEGVKRPDSFKGLRRWKDADREVTTEDADRDTRHTGWFQGDGDRVGSHLQKISRGDNAAREKVLHQFSLAMRQWGERLQFELPRAPADQKVLDRDGRVVYAGGDDFMGVLYRNAPRPELTAKRCLEWLYRFSPEIWRRHEQPITVSMGFVWASPQVPQRDVLQHCREAEASAKANGRDRVALRVLFAGGNHLEWHCPWRFLRLLEDYEHSAEEPIWTHIYKDVATLESRHAFQGSQSDVAKALLRVYFQHRSTEPENSDLRAFYGFLNMESLDVESDVLWNKYRDKKGEITYDPRGEHVSTGILGDRTPYTIKNKNTERLNLPLIHEAFTTWAINLAKVGFHLCSDT